MTFIYIILTVVFWASAFVGIRAALYDYHPFELAMLRYLIASFTLLIISFFNSVRLPDGKDLIRIMIMGFTGITIYNMALNYGELSITAGEASFILKTGPIFTTILAYCFLGEEIRARFIVGLVISFTGVALIVMDCADTIRIKTGSLLVLAAAASQASYFIIQKPLLKKYKPLEVTCYAIWSGSVFMLPLGSIYFRGLWSASFESTAAVIYLGVFPAALAYFCWSVVLSRIPAAKASSYLYLVPVFTPVIGLLWLNEFPSLTAVVGGTLAVLGVAFSNLNKDQKVRTVREILKRPATFSKH